MPDDEFTPETFLPYMLNQAAEESSLSFQKLYRERYGMLRTEWRVLFHLGLYGTLTAREIGQRSKLHKTKISRAVHRLSERRFVERNRDDADRRVEHLSLTRKGRSAYDDLRGTAERYEKELLAGFTSEEIEVLRRTLKKLSNLPQGGFT